VGIGGGGRVGLQEREFLLGMGEGGGIIEANTGEIADPPLGSMTCAECCWVWRW